MGQQFRAPRPTGPIRVDPHVAGRVKPSTLQRYRGAVGRFTQWLLDQGAEPLSAAEWDDWFLEWKAATAVTRTQFGLALAGVELFFPRGRSRVGS